MTENKVNQERKKKAIKQTEHGIKMDEDKIEMGMLLCTMAPERERLKEMTSWLHDLLSPNKQHSS